MKLIELYEGVAQQYDDFSQWSAAAKKLGAVTHTKSGDKRKIFATSDLKKVGVKSFGEWDEKENKGVVYSLRRKLDKIELGL